MQVFYGFEIFGPNVGGCAVAKRFRTGSKTANQGQQALQFGYRLLAALALVVSVASLAEARPYRLQWDANTDGVTQGYFVFYGNAPGTYQPPTGIDVGNVTEFQVDLLPGSTYYFRVRAYDSQGTLGPPSDELSFNVPVDASVTVTSATSVSPGATVTAAVANAPGLSRYDWVGFYPVGAGIGGYVAEKYLNNSSSPPGTPMTAGTVTFVAPATPGQYNVRFNSAAGVTLATSAIVTVNTVPRRSHCRRLPFRPAPR